MSDQVIEVTDGNFEQDVLKSEQPVLVDFWAQWCGPCRMIAPIVEQVAGEYAGRARVGKLDVDKNSSVPQKYGIKGIPTLILFKGGKEEERIVGMAPKDAIARMIDKHLGASSSTTSSTASDATSGVANA